MSDTEDFSEYSGLIREANKDFLIGKHNFRVTSKEDDGAWDDGKKRYKVWGVLTTANNFRTVLKLSEKAPKADIDALQKGSPEWKGKVLNVSNLAKLSEMGITLSSIKEDDEFQVETSRGKAGAGYDRGLLEAKRVLGPVNKAQSGKDDDIPF